MSVNADAETIQIESRRVFKSVRRSRSKAFCFLCSAEVELLSMPRAAKFCQTSQYEIFQLAENGGIHRIHNSRGEIMVCRNSLKNVCGENFHNAPTVILKPLGNQ